MHSPRITRCSFLAALALLFTIGSLQAVELRQVVSREHPTIEGTGRGLTIGRDGFVYIFGTRNNKGYVLRISRDGTNKFGFPTRYAITGVAANANGVVATSNAHFAKSVNTYDRRGNKLGTVGGFTGNDKFGWNAPGFIEVGASGDFYALDQHVNRVVQVSPDGRLVKSYPIRADGEPKWGSLWTNGFRVSEKDKQFYYITSHTLRCVGFDGRTRWKMKSQIGGNVWNGFTGGFDLDKDGRLYVNEGRDPIVHIFDSQGKPAGKIELKMGDRTPNNQRRLGHLRVFGDDIVIRQKSDTEIFQVYDRTNGKPRRVVSIDHEKLTVKFEKPVWIAAQNTAISISFDAGQRKIRPDLGVYLRPLGTAEFEELRIVDGKVESPRIFEGLCHLRVTAGIDGAES